MDRPVNVQLTTQDISANGIGHKQYIVMRERERERERIAYDYCIETKIIERCIIHYVQIASLNAF